jgi:hypothetical protein
LTFVFLIKSTLFEPLIHTLNLFNFGFKFVELCISAAGIKKSLLRQTQRGVKSMIFAESSQLHDAAGNQISLLHFAAGSETHPLHFVAFSRQKVSSTLVVVDWLVQIR